MHLTKRQIEKMSRSHDGRVVLRWGALQKAKPFICPKCLRRIAEEGKCNRCEPK